MEYKGGKVLIFPDYTSKVKAQRRAFREGPAQRRNKTHTEMPSSMFTPEMAEHPRSSQTRRRIHTLTLFI